MSNIDDQERETILALAHMAHLCSGHAGSLLDNGLDGPHQRPVKEAARLFAEINKILRTSLSSGKRSRSRVIHFPQKGIEEEERNQPGYPADIKQETKG